MLQRPEVSFQRLARAGRAWFACIAALSAAMHSADVAAEITDLQVEFWLGGEASLQRPEFGLTDRQTFLMKLTKNTH